MLFEPLRKAISAVLDIGNMMPDGKGGTIYEVPQDEIDELSKQYSDFFIKDLDDE